MVAMTPGWSKARRPKRATLNRQSGERVQPGAVPRHDDAYAVADGADSRSAEDALQHLVRQSQRGDKDAYRQLVEATQTKVYNLSYGILGNAQESEDMTQEAFLRAWRALPTFRCEAKFETWLHRITVNTCLNRRRKLRAELHVLDDEQVFERQPAADGDPLVETISADVRDHVWASVAELKAKYRTVITLFYRQQLSYQEIAETLSLPLGTVKAHLSRARRALAKILMPREEDGDEAM